MQIAVVSLFPEMFSALQDQGVVGKAIQTETLQLSCWNPRDHATDNYRRIDDRPYGGGPGMVMQPEPIEKSLQQACSAVGVDSRTGSEITKCVKRVYLSPQGKRFDHGMAQSIAEQAEQQSLVLLAGRYEGIDERVIEHRIDEEWSIGDFVLSGGELAAMVVVDAVARLLPNVLGHNESAQQDSFADGLLDCPHYTRPETYQGQTVPGVLLSGHHESIRRWRLQQALGRTWLRRPDLLVDRVLTDEENQLLHEFIDAINE
ncbi:MAG: tRNA (guanosine(37)-N1)-methyltransferase TrmD [Pseudomonadota bacterium]